MNRRARRGFAMVAVLLVLMALFVLCAPFLLTARNADRASAQLADRATARIALDTAARHARARLAASHPGLDRTPTFDSDEEIEVTNRFDEDFLDASDPNGVMWDLDVEDLAGRIDLNSASPHVLANLLDGVARLRAQAEADAHELQVGSTAGFEPTGLLWIGSGGVMELVAYAGVEPTRFTGLVRGVGAQTDEEGKNLPCAPSPASTHEVGAYAIDQRMFAFARWRIAAGPGADLAAFDTVAQVAEVETMAGDLGPDVLATLERVATVHGGVRAGARWERGARLVEEVTGQPDEGCFLVLDDKRYFNAGTTVMITDGERTEFGIVRSSNRLRIRLMDPLVNDYPPLTAVVRPLARRPVNVNTASPEVLRALFLNLKLRTSSARITANEANDLVELVVQSRPFTGFEDFARRVVLPAAGLEPLPANAPVPDLLARAGQLGELRPDGTRALVGFIDDDDARALYKNALNANDNELEFSTMPFAFTTRDVYRLELRAAVNAKSGVERARRVREEVDVVVPQQDLLAVWSRQEDFDEEPRLDRQAPGWLAGPAATWRYDRIFGGAWPTRASAHLGPYDSARPIDPPPEPDAPAELVFPEHEGPAWIQLAPSREDDSTRQRAGRVIHFDDETRHLEGRYLPDGALLFDPGERRVSWGAGLLQPLTLSLWIQPRAIEQDALFLDLARVDYRDSDRVSLLIEENDLVLRVLDGAGDHPEPSFVEHAEARYPLDEGPGLPLDVWTHVEIGVAGNRPDQMRLVVDGRLAPDQKGLTRLTAAIQPDSRRIPVESTEGFPDRCVLRIGDELIEAIKSGAESFDASFSAAGENAGFGGRLARERFTVEPNEQNLGVGPKDTAHAAGATVQLYGYSLPLVESLPATSAALSAELGPFGVARVVGVVEGTRELTENKMDPVNVLTGSGSTVTAGYGLPGDGSVEKLVLESADPDRSTEEMMKAFDPSGGYAAILGGRLALQVRDPLTQVIETVGADETGTRLGGVEVIAYRTWSGNHLEITKRGDAVGELANLAAAGVSDDVSGRGAFVFHYANDLGDYNETLSYQVMVVPISITYSGSQSAFKQATAGNSEFVQLTHAEGDAQLTEWVRYDELVGGRFVRDDPLALYDANEAAHAGSFILEPSDVLTAPSPQTSPPGGLTPGGRGGGGGGGGMMFSHVLFSPSEPAPPRAPATGQQGVSRYWDYRIGEAEVEIESLPVTRAVSSHLQFRGVLGTFSHQHPAQTPILPVFRLHDVDETAGWPGRFDRVTFFADLNDIQTDPGFPGVVLHAHRPLEYSKWSYQDTGTLDAEDAPPGAAVAQAGFDITRIFAALETPLRVPIVAAANPQLGAADTRTLPRMTAFPSGERPRIPTGLSIGGTIQGGRVPSAVVDEIVFGTDIDDYQRVVKNVLTEGGEDLDVRDVWRSPAGDVSASSPLAGMPADAGLLRIGGEILCYDSFDGATLHVPPQGRGLLGTEPRNHVPGSGVAWLENWRVSVLAGPMSAGDAAIPVVSSTDFPPSGTVLIDDELIHYTHLVGGVPRMPRASEVPGERDRRGVALFRGRYGTEPAEHAAGTPVLVFPFRYWDRWSERADAPELYYYELSVDQPDAFWKRSFWASEAAPAAGPRLGVLQRARPEVPWDADPEANEGLDVLWDGRLRSEGGEGNPIHLQSDRAAWRVFVRYEPGSFDPRLGLAHGWKTTPRLVLFGAEYMAPNRTLWRADR